MHHFQNPTNLRNSDSVWALVESYASFTRLLVYVQFNDSWL
jgi:hypothetical protein